MTADGSMTHLMRWSPCWLRGVWAPLQGWTPGAPTQEPVSLLLLRSWIAPNLHLHANRQSHTTFQYMPCLSSMLSTGFVHSFMHVIPHLLIQSFMHARSYVFSHLIPHACMYSLIPSLEMWRLIHIWRAGEPFLRTMETLSRRVNLPSSVCDSAFCSSFFRLSLKLCMHSTAGIVVWV